MEIIHQLNFKSKDEPKLLQILQNSGVKVKAINLPNRNGQNIMGLIPESSDIWPLVQPFIKKEKVRHHFETTFSEQEILAAEWLRIVNVYEQGYPQPEQTWVTHPNNYGEFCRSCGVFKQIKPFRIAEEPKLGKNSFMSLNWTGDTVFSSPEVINIWEKNQIKGFETWEVIIDKENKPAKSIVQIIAPIVTSPGLMNQEQLTQTFCTECGIAKYEYHRYGKMLYKKYSLPPEADIVRTYEWFGDGHFAYREIFVSNKLARVIIENKWEGLNMKVVELI